MTFNNIINRSVFSSVGTLLKNEDIDAFLRYFEYNMEFLSKFPHIIYSFNGEKSLVDILESIVKNKLPNSSVKFLFAENLGHTFGSLLSEVVIFEATKELTDVDFVWKFSNDVIITTKFLDIEVPVVDFYYINNIGYNVFSTCTTIEELVNKIHSREYFYPQTNYYIIKNKINFIPDKNGIYTMFKQYDLRQNKELKPWDVITKCECEHFLKLTVERNNLSSHMLLNDVELNSIINIIIRYKMWDGSHKNVAYDRLGGLCHFQWPNTDVMII